MSLLSICFSGERPKPVSAGGFSSAGSFCQRVWNAVREGFRSLMHIFSTLYCCSSPEYDFSTVTGPRYQAQRERIPPSGFHAPVKIEIYAEENDLDSMPGTPPPEDLLVACEEYYSEGSDLDEPVKEEDPVWAVPVASVRALLIRPPIKNGNFNPEWRGSLGADDPHLDIYTGRPLHIGNHGAARITMSGRIIPIYLPNKKQQEE